MVLTVSGAHLSARIALYFFSGWQQCPGGPLRTSSGREPKNAKARIRATEPAPPAADDQKEVETLKIETDLVMVPVIATDRNGLYIPDLIKNDFSISEDGVPQEIAFFATISVPFHVVLMLDTSASTEAKLGLIQQAAVAFVEQLQSRDRVKVISFDDQVRDLNDFTSDRAALKAAIYRTRSGQGTKLYDAFALALSSSGRIQGRKAIVIFTDGVDYHSDSATFDGTLRGLDEEGVLVYPIRYNTREDTERIARQQSDQVPQLPTIGVIRSPPAGTTVPTFPSDDPSSIPTSGTRNKTGPLGLPLPDEILRRRREDERDRDRDRIACLLLISCLRRPVADRAVRIRETPGPIEQMNRTRHRGALQGVARIRSACCSTICTSLPTVTSKL